MVTNFREATEFSLFIFGDCTLEACQPWGKIAVGGNATFTEVSVGVGMIPLPTPGEVNSVIVQGNFIWNKGQNIAGNTVVYPESTFEFTDVVHLNAPEENQPLRTTPIDFVEAEEYLSCASNQWASLDSNGETILNSEEYQLVLRGTSTTLNIFDFDGTNILDSGIGLEEITRINIVAPVESTIIINVHGEKTGFGSSTFQRNGRSFETDEDGYIVWNFYEALSLSVYCMIIQGSILAPLAAVSPQGTGMLNGQLIAKSFYSVESIGTLQPDDFELQGDLPEVCGEEPTGCCNIGLTNVDVEMTGEGAVVLVEGQVNNVRFCDQSDYIALGLSVYETSTGVDIPLGRQFIKVVYNGPVPFVPGCYDLPFYTKFIYIGGFCPDEPIIAVNALAQYICSAIEF